MNVQMLNTTLLKILLAINQVEKESCSVQLIRAPENYNGSNYTKKSEFLEAAYNIMMKSYSFPILQLDWSFTTGDINAVHKKSFARDNREHVSFILK